MRRGVSIKGYKDILGSDWHVHHLDWGASFMGMYGGQLYPIICTIIISVNSLTIISKAFRSASGPTAGVWSPQQAWCVSLNPQTCLYWEYGEAESRVLSFPNRLAHKFSKWRGAAALPGKPRSWFSLDRDWWQKPVCWSGEEGCREPRGTGFMDTILPRERARTTPHTHHPAKKIKGQNVVSSEINSPVSSVSGGSALLVYVRFSWIFPLQVCQHMA